jgi:hypothetical protein
MSTMMPSLGMPCRQLLYATMNGEEQKKNIYQMSDPTAAAAAAPMTA